MDWQPIETAPKDGTEILGYRKDCGVLLIRWTAPVYFLSDRELEQEGRDYDSDNLEDWFFADFICGGRLEGEETPTHWQPLPSSPSDKT